MTFLDVLQTFWKLHKLFRNYLYFQQNFWELHELLITFINCEEPSRKVYYIINGSMRFSSFFFIRIVEFPLMPFWKLVGGLTNISDVRQVFRKFTSFSNIVQRITAFKISTNFRNVYTFFRNYTDFSKISRNFQDLFKIT